jgi:hypothetical protein
MGFLDTHLLVEKARPVLANAIVQRGPAVWETVRSKLEAVPEREHERLRRAARLRHYAVDARHPPTVLRIDLIRARPASEAKVRISEATTRAIAAELSGSRQRLVELLASDGDAKKRFNRWLRAAPKARPIARVPE